MAPRTRARGRAQMARGEAFPKSARLHGDVAFQRVFASRCRASSGSFTVIAAGNGLPTPRMGLVVTKRSVRGAVDRNRLKRLARESFRRNAWRLAGVDVVVVAKPYAARARSGELHAELERLWQRVIRCKDS